MSEALKTLNNIRTLRAHARETDLATLEEMLEKLTTIVEDRREEENSARKEQEERQAKLEAFRQKLLEDGVLKWAINKNNAYGAVGKVKKTVSK